MRHVSHGTVQSRHHACAFDGSLDLAWSRPFSHYPPLVSARPATRVGERDFPANKEEKK